MNQDYRKINGFSTTEDDLERLMWYGARCTYWTDDWSLLSLSKTDKIPTCPICGSPGYQSQMDDWLESIKSFNVFHPGYFQFLLSIKEVCRGVTIAEAWKAKQKGPRQG